MSKTRRPASKPDDRVRITAKELQALRASAASAAAAAAESARLRDEVTKQSLAVIDLQAQLSARASSVLGQAELIVAGPRQAAYGHPKENFDCAAAMISAYLVKRGTIEIDAHDVGMIHILGKAAREAHSRTRDNIVDIAGYCRTIEMVDTPELPL